MNKDENEREQSAEIHSTCPTGMRMFNAEGNVIRLACDRWSCDHCRKVLSYRWATRIRYGLALWDGPSRHWTLTLSGKVKSPVFAFGILGECWDNLRKTMQRACGTWNYAAFVELHPSRAGIAHFHVVSLADCPGRLKDVAHHAGFGYQAKDDPITGRGASYYVSKYTSKQGEDMPKGFRRVRLSRGWPSLPEAAYDVALLIPEKHEDLPEYFLRVAATTGLSSMDVAARWEHKELDL